MQRAFTVTVAQWIRDGVARPGVQGEMRWSLPGSAPLVVPFQVTGSVDRLQVHLSLNVGQRTNAQVIELLTEARETWMLCPRVGCGRRVAKLYLPLGQRELACQSCHGIIRGYVPRGDSE